MAVTPRRFRTVLCVMLCKAARFQTKKTPDRPDRLRLDSSSSLQKLRFGFWPAPVETSPLLVRESVSSSSASHAACSFHGQKRPYSRASSNGQQYSIRVSIKLYRISYSIRLLSYLYTYLIYSLSKCSHQMVALWCLVQTRHSIARLRFERLS